MRTWITVAAIDPGSMPRFLVSESNVQLTYERKPSLPPIPYLDFILLILED
jgi:hypothetical protein